MVVKNEMARNPLPLLRLVCVQSLHSHFHHDPARRLTCVARVMRQGLFVIDLHCIYLQHQSLDSQESRLGHFLSVSQDESASNSLSNARRHAIASTRYHVPGYGTHMALLRHPDLRAHLSFHVICSRRCLFSPHWRMRLVPSALQKRHRWYCAESDLGRYIWLNRLNVPILGLLWLPTLLVWACLLRLAVRDLVLDVGLETAGVFPPRTIRQRCRGMLPIVRFLLNFKY